MEKPQASLVGIVITLLSILIMRWLAGEKKQLAATLGSRALAADAMETVACICFSFTLIVGLLLNYLLGWWWADPVASLIIAALLVREGREFWEEEQEVEEANAIRENPELAIK
jgi:divalent metal cation (Fe/Co/Zn/Cd) transporter